jgi:deoxyribodipyrimidine photolyase-related protein
MNIRRLCIVLGDQLDPASSLFDDFNPQHDVLWMAEVREEATHVWSHRSRIALFLSAMRHYAEAQRDSGHRVHYRRLGEHTAAGLAEALAEDLARLDPAEVVWVEPGDWRVAESLRTLAARDTRPWTLRPDRHFLESTEDFRRWAEGRKELRMEHFYRRMRQRTGVLMQDGKPVGGRWNFDEDNRESFDARGPGLLPAPLGFAPDALTREVLEEVAAAYPAHPGELASFDWPVTPVQAEAALDDFIRRRLPDFGRHQDAMWQGEPWLYHARLAAAMNLKLLSPARVIEAAEQAWQDGKAPLPAVEGFIRQVLGWREYVRGIYHLRMPAFLDANALGADAPLPAFYWTGDTDMACLRDALGQTLKYGYAHHIQRLMVTGLFALLLGVRPREVHAWYLAVYVDAIEWVELPNTLGMSQYADGGYMTSKPYCASGKYIDRMSNYCAGCRYRPDEAVGEAACPFTTLYWDFLLRHEQRFRNHPRAGLQWRSVDRLSDERKGSIVAQAAALKVRWIGAQIAAGGPSPVPADRVAD